jgi:hypothetical protein
VTVPAGIAGAVVGAVTGLLAVPVHRIDKD